MTTAAEWTGPADLSEQLARAFGRILAAGITGTPLFPLRLRLRRPTTRDLGHRFEEVRSWIRKLEEGSRTARGFGYEIDWIEIDHRQLGRNRVPDGIAVATESDALRLIGKEQEARRFREHAAATLATFPELKDWLARRPLTLVEHAADWQRILAVLAWFRDHPRSALYLRQLDIADVDSKFIETRRGLLSELLELVLPATAPGGARTFEQRFGLRSKPPTLRFRLLDARLAIGGLTDLAVPVEQLVAFSTPARRIFITENEINGLAFPAVANGLVIFGLGYGLDLLAGIDWLKDRDIHYWGDIDTHGFAMLDRLRAIFPAARSLLMDRATLLAHRPLWGREAAPHDGDLARLTEEERTLFDDLRRNRLGENVRLEQERIAYGQLLAALARISGAP
jgi:hypothetical protein